MICYLYGTKSIRHKFVSYFLFFRSKKNGAKKQNYHKLKASRDLNKITWRTLISVLSYVSIILRFVLYFLKL